MQPATSAVSGWMSSTPIDGIHGRDIVHGGADQDGLDGRDGFDRAVGQDGTMVPKTNAVFERSRHEAGQLSH